MGILERESVPKKARKCSAAQGTSEVVPRAFRRLVSKSCDECKGSFARGCEAKQWSQWTCSSLGKIFQPVWINYNMYQMSNAFLIIKMYYVYNQWYDISWPSCIFLGDDWKSVVGIMYLNRILRSMRIGFALRIIVSLQQTVRGSSPIWQWTWRLSVIGN
jgi:hypothetical protein